MPIFKRALTIPQLPPEGEPAKSETAPEIRTEIHTNTGELPQSLALSSNFRKKANDGGAEETKTPQESRLDGEIVEEVLKGSKTEKKDVIFAVLCRRCLADTGNQKTNGRSGSEAEVWKSEEPAVILEWLLARLSETGTAVCQNCKAPHLPNDKFCRQCGTARPAPVEVANASLPAVESLRPEGGFGPRALLAAAESGNAELCMAMLDDEEYAASAVNRVDGQGNTAFIWAAYKEMPEVCLKILRMPPTIFKRLNTLDLQGNSALSWAAYNSLSEVCLEILKRSDFEDQHNRKDEDGNTPLHWAAERGLDEVCSVILARNDFTEVNAVDQIYDRTVLHLAAFRGLTSVCLMIVRLKEFKGINAMDVAGNTALHFAAMKGLVPVVKAIMKREDFNSLEAKDFSFGRTAFDWAQVKGHVAVAEALTSRPSVVDSSSPT